MAFKEPRNDLHLTTAGTVHKYYKPLGFPPKTYMRTVSKPLPTRLMNDCFYPKSSYKTTTGRAHNYKPTNSVLCNEIHQKAPWHRLVNYTLDISQKLNACPQRKQLIIGNQSSEMKSQFTGRLEMKIDPKYSCSFLSPMYQHHINSGSSLKAIVPSTKDHCVRGDTFYLRDKGVFSYHGDPYITTTQRVHRAFTNLELSKYPKKEYGTYWQCENYPKTWGHGSWKNPLPPLTQEKKYIEEGPRVLNQMKTVPKSGLRSEMESNFRDIPSCKRDELFDCFVQTPWQLQSPGKDEIFAVPKMYQSEYESIGGKKQS